MNIVKRIFQDDDQQAHYEGQVSRLTPERQALADALFNLERHGEHDFGAPAAPIYVMLATELFEKPEERRAIMRMLAAIDTAH